MSLMSVGGGGQLIRVLESAELASSWAKSAIITCTNFRWDEEGSGMDRVTGGSTHCTEEPAVFCERSIATAVDVKSTN